MSCNKRRGSKSPICVNSIKENKELQEYGVDLIYEMNGKIQIRWRVYNRYEVNGEIRKKRVSKHCKIVSYFTQALDDLIKTTCKKKRYSSIIIIKCCTLKYKLRIIKI